MSVSFTPYLSFRGQAREAMGFYQSVFGGELNVTTFAEGNMTDGVNPDEVMHSQIDGPVPLMGADVPESMPLTQGSSISLCFSGDASGLDTGRDYWAKLAEGGQVSMPLDLAPWGDYYGSVTDKFGMSWMFDFSAPEVPSDASALHTESTNL
ncbi:VOC family protein [Gryllotalpicola reticulitermitis]|uniref:VOC family protein n=1 Tax=Gryllotalpicola reticulitermitis TaxID=1184153 RepID=A0ABV8Q2B6_9MICO